MSIMISSVQFSPQRSTFPPKYSRHTEATSRCYCTVLILKSVSLVNKCKHAGALGTLSSVWLGANHFACPGRQRSKDHHPRDLSFLSPSNSYASVLAILRNGLQYRRRKEQQAACTCTCRPLRTASMGRIIPRVRSRSEA